MPRTVQASSQTVCRLARLILRGMHRLRIIQRPMLTSRRRSETESTAPVQTHMAASTVIPVRASGVRQSTQSRSSTSPASKELDAALYAPKTKLLHADPVKCKRVHEGRERWRAPLETTGTPSQRPPSTGFTPANSTCSIRFSVQASVYLSSTTTTYATTFPRHGNTTRCAVRKAQTRLIKPRGAGGRIKQAWQDRKGRQVDWRTTRRAPLIDIPPDKRPPTRSETTRGIYQTEYTPRAS